MTAWLLVLLDVGAAHGYELARALRARHLDIDPSGVYRRLRKLEDDGWIESDWRSPLAGPRRRVYSLAPEGERALEEIAARIVVVRDLHEEFVRAHEQACAGRVATTSRERRDVHRG